MTIIELRAAFKNDGLTPSELLVATGLKQERLMEWYKRQVLPEEFPRMPGRGNRRRYSVDDAELLTMIRLLADAGVLLAETAPLARRLRFLLEGRLNGEFVWDCITQHQEPTEALEALTRRETNWSRTRKRLVDEGVSAPEIDELEKGINADLPGDTLALITLRPTGYKGDALLARSGRFRSEKYIVLEVSERVDIRAFMRANTPHHGILVDYAAAGVIFYKQIAAVHVARELRSLEKP